MTFNDALDITLKFEGGWSHDPADRGGETYAGISRRSWPDWPGWALLTTLARSVADFYEQNFWRPWARLGETRLRAKLFDAGVHVGLAGAVRLLQRALRRQGHELAVDGRLGPLTLTALAATDEERLLTLICQEQAAHYQRIAAAGPGQRKFEKGWQRRARWRP
jgi:lysozyme family protein